MTPLRRLLILCLMLCSASSIAADMVFRFAYEDREIYPYMMGEGATVPDKPGVTVELVQHLQKRIPGLKVELQRMPWRRCLNNLQQGESDAVVASFNKERTLIGVYPMKNDQPDVDLRSGTSSYSLYKKKISSLSWDGSRFIGLTGAIGAPMSWSIGDDLKKMGVQIDASPSTQRDFEKLMLDRVAGVAALTEYGDMMLERPEYRSVVKVSPPLASKHYYLMLSHQFVQKNPALAKRIWQTLAELRDSESDRLLRRYLD